MHFVLLATDRPDAGDLRARERANHRAYLTREGHDGAKVALGGPLLAADEETMVGSMIIIEARDLAAAEAFAAGDPYRKAGLFSEWSLRPWSWVINKPI
jgi:uncharacterized protein YciI